MGHCCYYSIEIFVVDYDSYHCLLLMIYVLGLASVTFVGGGGLCCYAFTPLHIVITMFTFCGCHGLFFLSLRRLIIIGIHTIGYVRYYTIVAYAICVTV